MVLIIVLLLGASLQAQSTHSAPTNPNTQKAAPANPPMDKLSTVVLYPPRQPIPPLKPFLSRLSTAFAEADEILQLKDTPTDFACSFHFERGPVTRVVWEKRSHDKESDTDLELRRRHVDVDSAEDGKEVERIPGNIKVVGRIEDCNGKGPAQLNTTTIVGCAFRNATFMVATDSLSDIPRRGVVIAHEFGHNVRNEDTDDPLQVMHRRAPEGLNQGRQVTPAQCKKYTGPRRSLYQVPARQQFRRKKS